MSPPSEVKVSANMSNKKRKTRPESLDREHKDETEVDKDVDRLSKAENSKQEPASSSAETKETIADNDFKAKWEVTERLVNLPPRPAKWGTDAVPAQDDLQCWIKAKDHYGGCLFCDADHFPPHNKTRTSKDSQRMHLIDRVHFGKDIETLIANNILPAPQVPQPSISKDTFAGCSENIQRGCHSDHSGFDRECNPECIAIPVHLKELLSTAERRSRYGDMKFFQMVVQYLKETNSSKSAFQVYNEVYIFCTGRGEYPGFPGHYRVIKTAGVQIGDQNYNTSPVAFAHKFIRQFNLTPQLNPNCNKTRSPEDQIPEENLWPESMAMEMRESVEMAIRLLEECGLEVDRDC